MLTVITWLAVCVTLALTDSDAVRDIVGVCEYVAERSCVCVLVVLPVALLEGESDLLGDPVELGVADCDCVARWLIDGVRLCVCVTLAVCVTLGVWLCEAVGVCVSDAVYDALCDLVGVRV